MSDETMVDVGGGMVVPLRELIDDDGYEYDDLDENDDDPDCTLCGGEGHAECNDPIQCMARHIGSGEYLLCPCIGCGGSGHGRDQRIW